MAQTPAISCSAAYSPGRPISHVSFLMTAILALSTFCSLAHGATRIIDPGQSIQEAIDRAADGDVILLEDGVYYETLDIRKSITLKAEHGGEAIVTNRHKGPISWIQTSPGSHTWSAQGIDWPVHRLLVEGVHAFDYRSKENFDNRTCGPYWSKGWQAGTYSYTNPPLYFAHDATSGRTPSTMRWSSTAWNRE